MKLFLLLGTALLLSGASALCPNTCSGHGACGATDKCTCYENWMSPDCSERVCPFTKSWADVKDAETDDRQEHYYLECGGKGTCDRKTGLCECFTGFEGKGCRRMSCPGEPRCSGHGTCATLAELNSGDSWDSDKIQLCQCDPGWHGYACDKRTCQPGDDPMTLFGTYEVQEIDILWDTAAGDGQIVLSFTDWRNEKWTTWPIDVSATAATGISVISVEEALRSLPNHAIPAATVTFAATQVGVTTSYNYVLTIQFTHPQNSGVQNTILVENTACIAAGCQPINTGLTVTSITYAKEDTDGASLAASSENAVCSNRGMCDTESGLCTCLDGYYGQACEQQTVIL